MTVSAWREGVVTVSLYKLRVEYDRLSLLEQETDRYEERYKYGKIRGQMDLIQDILAGCYSESRL